MNYDKEAALLSAMGNSKRLEILSILEHDEVAVSVLCQMTNLSQSALSQHLAKLRDLGLVKSRRDGATMFYKGNSEVVSMVLRAVEHLRQTRVVVPGYEPTSIVTSNSPDHHSEEQLHTRPSRFG